MISALLGQLTARSLRRIALIAYRAPAVRPVTGPVTDILCLRGHFAHGSIPDLFRFVTLASHFETFILVGADCVDGFYSESRSVRRIQLAGLAAKLGVSSSIVGFSFNATPAPSSIAAFSALPASVAVVARDALSARRLQGHTGRNVQLGADLAFLLEAHESERLAPVVGWISGERHQGRVVLAINANALIARWVAGATLETLITAYEEALTIAAARSGLSYVFVSHDLRGEHNDAAIAAQILERLPAEVRKHTLSVSPNHSAAEVKALAGCVDAALTGRMHFAIACLGRGVPVLCISYQDKTEGLYEHFSLRNLTLPAAAALTGPELGARLIQLVEERAVIRQRIAEQLPAIRGRALLNLRALGPASSTREPVPLSV